METGSGGSAQPRRPPADTAFETNDEQSRSDERCRKSDPVGHDEGHAERYSTNGDRPEEDDQGGRTGHEATGESHHHQLATTHNGTGRREDMVVRPSAVSVAGDDETRVVGVDSRPGFGGEGRGLARRVAKLVRMGVRVMVVVMRRIVVVRDCVLMSVRMVASVVMVMFMVVVMRVRMVVALVMHMRVGLGV